MSNFFETFPALHPGWTLFVYVLLPWIPIVVGVYSIQHEHKWRGGPIYSFLCNLTVFVYRFAPIIVLANLFWSGIIMVNQAAYAYRHMDWHRNPSYFLSVDLPSFNNLQAINYATIQDSFNAITALSSGRRRLQLEPVDTTLTLTYHTKTFENLVDAKRLKQICQTELNILKASSGNDSCIDVSRYSSVLPSYFQMNLAAATCTQTSTAYANLARMDNSLFVQDYIDPQAPETPVLLSFFDLGACRHKYTPREFSRYLQKFVPTNATDLVVTYTTPSLNQQAVEDLTTDAGRLLTVTVIVCYVVLAVWLRGLVMPLVTMFGFFFALVNAAAFLPVMDFTGFSVLNLGGVLVLLCFGSSAALAWAAAWRRQVKPAVHPTVANIMNAYLTTGQTLAYLTALGVMACCSLLASPVAVVAQFGAFTGLAVLFFFLYFHYLFVPAWVLTSWFVLPKKYHRAFRAWRALLCPCYERLRQFFREQKGWGSAALIAEFVPDEEDDADFLEEEEVEERNRYVQADQVQVLGHGPGRGQSFGYSGASQAEGGPVEAEDYDEEGEEVDPDDPEQIISNVEEGTLTNRSQSASVLGAGMGVEMQSLPSQRSQRSLPSQHSRAHLSGYFPAGQPAPVTPQQSLRSLQHGQSLHSLAPSEAGEVVASPVEAEEEEETAPELQEMEHDTNFCRGKRPLKFFGLFTLVVVLIALLVVYIISVQKFRLDLGLPQLLREADSNLGRQFAIAENYKSSLFDVHQAENIFITTLSPTRSPTRAPFSLRPTPAPTRRPTAAPTTGTRSPTKSPTSAAYVDYHVLGCWGIDAHTHGRDGRTTASYDYRLFQAYVNNRFESEVSSFCNAVNLYRDKLDVSPDWSVGRDCLAQQLVEAKAALPATVPKSMNNALFQWAQTSRTSGNFLGVLSNSSVSQAAPVWVCANFSLRSFGFASFREDPGYFADKEKQWRDFFDSNMAFAQAMDVPLLLSSPAFTFPLLSHRQQPALAVVIACVVLGFVGLLWLATLSDYGLTLFGSLSIFVVLVVTLCVHLFIESERLDVFDFMAVPAVVLLMADLPVTLIEEYMAARAAIDRQQAVQADKALSPALAVTNKHFRQTVLGPSLLLIFVSLAPLGAQLLVVRRVASYVVILALVSLAFTVLFEPYVLAFGCRTRHCEKLCYVDEDDAPPDDLTPAGGAGSSGGQRNRAGLASPASNETSPNGPTVLTENDESQADRYSSVSGATGGQQSHRLSAGSSSTYASRSFTANSAASVGVMSLPGSVSSSGLRYGPMASRGPNSMYRTPPAYYPVMAGDPDYGVAMTSPAGSGGSMYYPAPPGPGPAAAASMHSMYRMPSGQMGQMGQMGTPVGPGGQQMMPPMDPRLLMSRPDLLALYQQQQYAAAMAAGYPPGPPMANTAGPAPLPMRQSSYMRPQSSGYLPAHGLGHGQSFSGQPMAGSYYGHGQYGQQFHPNPLATRPYSSPHSLGQGAAYSQNMQPAASGSSRAGDSLNNGVTAVALADEHVMTM